MTSPSPIADLNLGFSVADGEQVEVTFRNGDLELRFVDWRENPVTHVFEDVFAYRWATRPSVPTPRDDMVYEVTSSAWARDEANDDRCDPADVVHAILCFNAAGVLEVLYRRGTEPDHRGP